MKGISHLPPETILNYFKILTDYCYDHPDSCQQEMRHWKNWLEQVERKMRNHSLAYYYYFYESHYWTIRNMVSKKEENDWNNLNQERIISSLRKSFVSMAQIKDGDYIPEMMEQILSNIGTTLSEMGRFIESIRYFQMILNNNRNFNMAWGNRGVCLFRLAQNIADNGERYVLLKTARVCFDKVKQDHIVTEYNNREFKRIASIADSELQKIPNHIKDRYRKLSTDIGTSDKREKEYRMWALNCRLFLNVLGDAGIVDEAASDNLCPFKSLRKENNYYQKFDGFFNHLIEQFSTARWFYYDGAKLDPKKQHYAEKRIYYQDLGDRSINTLSKEKIFASFRTCYSIFDKVAFYLNEYFELGISNNMEINLRKLWYKDYSKNKQLRRSVQKHLENPHLKALYWLSKDVYYNERDEELVEPAAREWNKIRNHLTHQFIRVTPTGWDQSYQLDDPASYCISYDDLKDRCLRMLQLVRDTLIYLSLAVTYEEYRHDAAEKPYFGYLNIQLSDEMKKKLKDKE